MSGTHHPPVSIIVTVYNMESYLEQCLDSIVSQSFREIEVILVDDGSTDRSVEICDRYTEDDNRFTLIQQENSGVSSARNRGIRSASGDWIMFVDCDDWLAPDAVAVLYENAAQVSDCDIAAAAYFMNYQTPVKEERFVGDISQQDKQYTYDLGSNREDIIRFALTSTGIPELAAIGLNLRTPWAKLFRRTLLTDNDIYFIPGLDKGEDRIFNLYALKASRKLVVINHPLYHSRFRFDSLDHKYTGIVPLTDPVNDWIRETREFLNQCPSINNDVYYKFLFFVLRTTADFCFNSYLSGSQSCSEAAKDLELLFEQKLYREMIATVNSNRHSAYFTTADRLSFRLLRTGRYLLYLRIRRYYFYRTLNHKI